MKWKRGQEGRQRYISTYIYTSMYIICTRHARIRLPGKVMRQLSEKNTSEHFKAPQKPRLVQSWINSSNSSALCVWFYILLGHAKYSSDAEMPQASRNCCRSLKSLASFGNFISYHIIFICQHEDIIVLCVCHKGNTHCVARRDEWGEWQSWSSLCGFAANKGLRTDSFGLRN